jgi:membrane protease YdiL (CAAX protease family)
MHAEDVGHKKLSSFKFLNHPWISLVVIIVTWVIVLIITIIAASVVGITSDAPYRPFIVPTLAHLLAIFVLAPFVFRLPNGKTTMRKYLDDIRLSRVQPFLPLLILGITSAFIMLLALALNSLVYRFVQGLPLSLEFLGSVIDLRGDLPPASPSYIVSFPSIFEEVMWRGVILVLFLRRYTVKQSILITALGFGFLHFINLLFGSDPAFVIRQVILGTGIGFFYAYLVLRSDSLMPAMIFHYFVNMFIFSFTHYFQHYAPAGTQSLYLIVNLSIAVPVLILWVKYFCSRWISKPVECKPIAIWSQQKMELAND